MSLSVDDPNYIGPGYWTMIHTNAITISNSKQLLQFIDLIDMIATTFPCHKCREHMNEYLSKNPLPKKFKNSECFKWSHAFHNAVNRRLNKPIMSYQDAYSMYSNIFTKVESDDEDSCSLECSNSE